MKKLLPALSLVFFSAFAAHAQQGQNPSLLGCIDADTRLRSDEVKQHYKAQGFAVVRDAMMHMRSHEPVPVVIGLDKSPYQIVFISNAKATEMDVELLNPERRKLVSLTEKSKRTERHVISFPFVPPTKDAYLIVLRQKLKQEETCGGFMILRDTLANRRTPVVPF